jgi:hypothetical protein
MREVGERREGLQALFRCPQPFRTVARVGSSGRRDSSIPVREPGGSGGKYRRILPDHLLQPDAGGVAGQGKVGLQAGRSDVVEIVLTGQSAPGWR